MNTMTPTETQTAGLEPPSRLELVDPAPFLMWLAQNPEELSLDNLVVAEVWGLVALATLARIESSDYLRILDSDTSKTSRFAHALGFNDVVDGLIKYKKAEQGRTVKLRRVSKFAEIEPAANEISRLLIQQGDQQDTRQTVFYVIVELLRNVVQHSCDPLGGVIAAQRNDRPDGSPRAFQVAVADAGIGVPRHLQQSHPKLTDPREALDKALWPHVSGTFEEGLTGTMENAGMGLFFIAEMAKLTAGQLMIASRGATLILKGDANFEGKHSLKFIEPTGTGYPGTLVTFEMPVDAVEDYQGLIETIRERAKERTPRRAVHKWIRHDAPPPQAQRFLVRLAVEDTSEAVLFAQEHLLPRIIERKPVALDFQSIPICTQSFLHALLFEPLRVAWALRTQIYVVNVQPGVRSNLELLENYALGG